MELVPNDERFRYPETHYFEWGDIQIQTSKAKLSIPRSPSQALKPPLIRFYPPCDSTSLGVGDPNRHLNTPLLKKTENISTLENIKYFIYNLKPTQAGFSAGNSRLDMY